MVSEECQYDLSEKSGNLFNSFVGCARFLNVFGSLDMDCNGDCVHRYAC